MTSKILHNIRRAYKLSILGIFSAEIRRDLPYHIISIESLYNTHTEMKTKRIEIKITNIILFVKMLNKMKV